MTAKPFNTFFKKKEKKETEKKNMSQLFLKIESIRTQNKSNIKIECLGILALKLFRPHQNIKTHTKN